MFLIWLIDKKLFHKIIKSLISISGQGTSSVPGYTAPVHPQKSIGVKRTTTTAKSSSRAARAMDTEGRPLALNFDILILGGGGNYTYWW